MSEHASLKSFEYSAKYNSLFDNSLKKGSIKHIQGDSDMWFWHFICIQ